MQGWRISMEDAHTAVLDLIGNKDGTPSADKLAFFGVFDGHGGDKVALFAGENIHNIIAKQDTFKAGDYTQGLKDGFLATDRAILNGMRQTKPNLTSLLVIRANSLVSQRSQVRGGGLRLHSLCRFACRQKDLCGMFTTRVCNTTRRFRSIIRGALRLTL